MISINIFSGKFDVTKIVGLSDKHTVISDDNHSIHNHNLKIIEEHIRIHWQKLTKYGKRNDRELSIQRREVY